MAYSEFVIVPYVMRNFRRDAMAVIHLVVVTTSVIWALRVAISAFPTHWNRPKASALQRSVSLGHLTSHVVCPLTNQSINLCIYPAAGTHR